MAYFSALADPTRAHIISLLAENGRLPVSAINKNFKMSAPAISQHLKILRSANLVDMEINAQQRFYTLNITAITEVENWAKGVRNSWEQLSDRLENFITNHDWSDENE